MKRPVDQRYTRPERLSADDELLQPQGLGQSLHIVGVIFRGIASRRLFRIPMASLVNGDDAELRIELARQWLPHAPVMAGGVQQDDSWPATLPIPVVQLKAIELQRAASRRNRNVAAHLKAGTTSFPNSSIERSCSSFGMRIMGLTTNRL